MTLALNDLKSRHRAMWASGYYPALAADLLPELGEVLVQACRVRPGDRVLDVAAGSGTAAIPAALAGGRVTAADLTPELLAAGKALAAKHGATITWQEADAEALPYPDGAFDVVLSCLGVMFAPDHRASAADLLRDSLPPVEVGRWVTALGLAVVALALRGAWGDPARPYASSASALIGCTKCTSCPNLRSPRRY